ncbi:hypothetical protein NL676_028563 [Syzygium grande]|nr:hypothetical protein NL676_028563 [Syzygium grande]
MQHLRRDQRPLDLASKPSPQVPCHCPVFLVSAERGRDSPTLAFTRFRASAGLPQSTWRGIGGDRGGQPWLAALPGVAKQWSRRHRSRCLGRFQQSAEQRPLNRGHSRVCRKSERRRSWVAEREPSRSGARRGVRSEQSPSLAGLRPKRRQSRCGQVETNVSVISVEAAEQRARASRGFGRVG